MFPKEDYSIVSSQNHVLATLPIGFGVYQMPWQRSRRWVCYKLRWHSALNGFFVCYIFRHLRHWRNCQTRPRQTTQLNRQQSVWHRHSRTPGFPTIYIYICAAPLPFSYPYTNLYPFPFPTRSRLPFSSSRAKSALPWSFHEFAFAVAGKILVFSAGIFHNFPLALSDFSSTFFSFRLAGPRFVALLSSFSPKFSAEFSCYCRNRTKVMNGLINSRCLVNPADQTAAEHRWLPIWADHKQLKFNFPQNLQI